MENIFLTDAGATRTGLEVEVARRMKCTDKKNFLTYKEIQMALGAKS